MLDGRYSKIIISEGKPAGASVYYKDAFIGYAPCAIYPKKRDLKKHTLVLLKKEGYATQTVEINKKIMVGYVIADVLLGVVPLFVDMAVNTLAKPVPDFIIPSLEKELIK
ncbi:MAG: hypothetical protein JNK61_09405 [Bacteroidia bacterium]|nr:hypothetical protein [Bacteroidia bacterium]